MGNERGLGALWGLTSVCRGMMWGLGFRGHGGECTGVMWNYMKEISRL